MKRLITILFATVLFATLGNCQRVKTYANEVSAYDGGTTESGTLWIQGSGYGKKPEVARLDAEKAIFRHLLFQGIPGTTYNLPMVPDESISKRDHAAFYTGFFEKGGYREFIMTSSTGALNKVVGNKRMDVQMKVNVNALRTHLEKNDIMRKFGL